jgi:nucleoside-diphosphate-sugar epimerase
VSRALIAGGSGFIGSHLARHLLDEGWEVDLADDLSRGRLDADLEELLRRPGAQLLERDLVDAASLAGEPDDAYEVVYNLAAIVGVANVVRAPYRVLEDNVLIALNLLRFAAGQRGLRRFVFASTSEVYAGTQQQFGVEVPTPEAVPVALPALDSPRASYLLSKAYGEALSHQSGLPFTVVRPHNVYGPRMGLSHVIPELLQRSHDAPDGGELEVFSPDHRRTFCFVDDAVEILARAAAAPDCAGEVLNLGREAPEVSIRELAAIVIGTVGKRLTIVPGPDTAGSPPRRAPDMSKTARLTGYEARVGLEDGVERTYAWYRENVFAAVA